MAHQAGVYVTMRRIGVFLFRMDGMLVHRRGTPQHKIRRYSFIHLDEERHYQSKVPPQENNAVPRPGLGPARS